MIDPLAPLGASPTKCDLVFYGPMIGVILGGAVLGYWASGKATKKLGWRLAAAGTAGAVSAYPGFVAGSLSIMFGGCGP